MRLITFGYEGLTSEQFFDVLISSSVQTLVDVRELPLSRKPGFSKSALALSAAVHGLTYIHIPELGCPRDIRHDYRSDNNWLRYTQRFKAYLSTQDIAVRELAKRAQSERCCLLCYEADFNFCHRSFVAQRVATVVGNSLKVVHLTIVTQSKVVPIYSPIVA